MITISCRTFSTALATAALAVALPAAPAVAAPSGATVTNISEGVSVRAWLTGGREVRIAPGATREGVAEVNWPRCVTMYSDRGTVTHDDGRAVLSEGGYIRVEDYRRTTCH